MLFAYSALFLAFIGHARACTCPQFFGDWELKKDPVYKICADEYVTRIKLSKLDNYTCVQDPARNIGCLMRAEVIEDFFAPLKETNRKPPTADRFLGDQNSALCGVSLPKPGDYIINARMDGDVFSENACNKLREPYSDKRAAEIRETVKKCPKERLSYSYWVGEGEKRAMVVPTKTTKQ